MADSIMEQVTGRDRPLLGGVVTEADADSASLFDMARHILGNPYEERSDDDVAPPPDEGSESAGAGTAFPA
jgi:hypothetical protein